MLSPDKYIKSWFFWLTILPWSISCPDCLIHNDIWKVSEQLNGSHISQPWGFLFDFGSNWLMCFFWPHWSCCAVTTNYIFLSRNKEESDSPHPFGQHLQYKQNHKRWSKRTLLVNLHFASGLPSLAPAQQLHLSCFLESKCLHISSVLYKLPVSGLIQQVGITALFTLGISVSSLNSLCYLGIGVYCSPFHQRKIKESGVIITSHGSCSVHEQVGHDWVLIPRSSKKLTWL